MVKIEADFNGNVGQIQELVGFLLKNVKSGRIMIQIMPGNIPTTPAKLSGFDPNKLNDLLKTKEYTQTDFSQLLAQKLGRNIDQGTVSRWISRRQAPKIDVINAMAEILLVEVTDLCS